MAVVPLEARRARHEARLLALRAGMFLVDLVATAGALAFVLSRHPAAAGRAIGHWPFALLSGLVWVLALAVSGGYSITYIGRRAELTTRVIQASLMAVVALVLLDFSLRPAFPMPGRGDLFLFWAGATAAILVFRWTVWRWAFVQLLRGRLTGSAVVIGADPNSQERCSALLRWMLFPPRIVAVLDGEGVADRIEEMARDGAIDQVLLVRDAWPRDTLIELVQRCVGWGLQVTVASPTFNVMVGRAPVFVLDGRPVIEIQPSGLFGPARHLKRGLDLAGALLGLLILLPLFGVVAALIRLTSPGPVFYRQERVGRGGRIFYFYKFRSMVANNDDRLHRAYLEQMVRNGAEAAHDAGGQRLYKIVNDPRVTPVGAFLRRTSIDELPQLWNVIKGEMSLVGPRPCLPYEWELYKDWQKRRLDVTPGLTGLWQVTGRSRVPFEDMVLLDLYYIAHWSVRLDLELILRTLPVMVSGRGGH